MKLIKLDHRHRLKRLGYDWAFRFNGWESNAHKVESAVKQLEGWRWNNTFWSKTKGEFASRYYYVGVKNESTATMVLLKAGA